MGNNWQFKLLLVIGKYQAIKFLVPHMKDRFHYRVDRPVVKFKSRYASKHDLDFRKLFDSSLFTENRLPILTFISQVVKRQNWFARDLKRFSASSRLEIESRYSKFVLQPFCGILLLIFIAS